MTFYRKQFWSVAILFWIVCPAVGASEKRPCSEEDAKLADKYVDTLKTWRSIYSFYTRYSQCDDGGIAEGVSDAVAKLLANRWDSFGELVKLASRDEGFENFVIRHVDETIDQEQDAPKIRQNAKLRCPPGSAELCKALLVKTVLKSK